MNVIDGSRMTREYYFRIIGKNIVSNEDRSLLMVDRSVTAYDTIKMTSGLNLKSVLNLNFEDQQTEMGDSGTPKPFDGQGIYKLNRDVPFSPGIKTTYNSISSDYFFYLRASVYVYSLADDIREKLYLVITTTTPDKKDLKYRAFSFKDLNIDFISGTWNKLSYDYLTPEVFTKEEIVQSYVWYNGEGIAWIDDYTIDAFTPD
jgi:hypothetical protein